MSLPSLNLLRQSMYPDEWAWLVEIGRSDKARAKDIAQRFWSGISRDPRMGERMRLTMAAWREFDGE